MGDKVSIIVTHYAMNQERSDIMRQSIKSLIKTAKQAEIIVIDNGDSKEDSEFLLDKCVKGHIACYIRNRKNMQFWHARNQGLKICTGDYIVIADNDIDYISGWLEGCLKWLKKNKDKGKYLCSPLEADPMNRHREIRWDGEQDGWRLNWRAGSNVFMGTREAFDEIGYFLEDRRSGSLWCDAFGRLGYRVALMPEPSAFDLGIRKGFDFKQPITKHESL